MKLNQKTIAVFLATVAVSNAFSIQPSNAANVNVDQGLTDNVAFVSANDLSKKQGNTLFDFSQPDGDDEGIIGTAEKITMTETTVQPEPSVAAAKEVTSESIEVKETIITKTTETVEKEPTLLAKTDEVATEAVPKVVDEKPAPTVKEEPTVVAKTTENDVPAKLEEPVVEKTSESTLIAEGTTPKVEKTPEPPSPPAEEKTTVAEAKPLEEAPSSTLAAESSELDEPAKEKMVEKEVKAPTSEETSNSDTPPTLEKETTKLVSEEPKPSASATQAEDPIKDKVLAENTPVPENAVASSTEELKEVAYMDSLSSADVDASSVAEPLAFVAKRAPIIEEPDMATDAVTEVATAVDGAIDGMAENVIEGATGAFAGLIQSFPFIL